MKQRCLNPCNHKYPSYGGRGIKICEAWLSIRGFFEWATNNGWSEGKTIDRIDNDGDYCPENCRWISVSENSRKKRTTKLSYDQAKEIRHRVSAGENEKDIAKEFGVVHGTVWFVVRGYTHVPEGDCTKMLKNRTDSKILI
jgi:hypothetical protein